MLSRSRPFRADAMVGFLVVILLLTLGMSFALRRIEHVTARQLADVQAKEHELTLVERLRSSGELFVSVERGYLLTGEPSELTNLALVKRDFDTAVAALQKTEVSPAGAKRVDDVYQAAMAFEAVQEELVQQRSTTDFATILERFELELVPARQTLRRALDELVGHKSAVIERMYSDAKDARDRLMRWMYALLATLAVASLYLSWLATQRLARTYRRETEALETARQALAARDELMGIIAHDLRSPLGAITMRAELLESITSDAKTREQAAALKNTASRMADLIKTMLDVTVIEAGQFKVHAVPCEVDELLRRELEIHSMIAASKQIQLERRVSEPGLSVMADRERIFQVISNLVGNAIKFTPKGGVVTIAVERAGEQVAFTISDTGPGIPTENLPHVFERYWKDESRGPKGTGLGLFIARSIVEAHGGTISVTSSPGSGATFRFTLKSAPGSATSKFAC